MLGGQKFWENIFSEKKHFENIPLFSEISDDLFLSHRQLFFKNLHPSFKIYSLFFVFFFLCLCFCILSCFYIKKFKKFNSRLIIGGGQKRGFVPHLNDWGCLPGLPPESTPMPPLKIKSHPM